MVSACLQSCPLRQCRQSQRWDCLGLWLSQGQGGPGQPQEWRGHGRAGGRGWQLSGWHPKATHPFPFSVSALKLLPWAVPAPPGPQAGAALTPSLLLKAGALPAPTRPGHLQQLSPSPRAPGGSVHTWIHALPSVCGAPSVCHSVPPPACANTPVLHTSPDATTSKPSPSPGARFPLASSHPKGLAEHSMVDEPQC